MYNLILLNAITTGRLVMDTRALDVLYTISPSYDKYLYNMPSIEYLMYAEWQCTSNVSWKFHHNLKMDHQMSWIN